MIRVLLALPVLLVACSGPTEVAVGPQATPGERACATQVDDDPQLEQARAISAGRLSWEWMYLPQIEQIKRDAMTRCLRARGEMPRGGVERPR